MSIRSDRDGAVAIVHRDDALVVLVKPSGLPAVPGRAAHLHDCAALRVQRDAPDARVVHRLDMATSGLMVMALGASAQRRLGTAFARREVDKRYLAVVAGRLVAPHADAEGWAEIALPLAADWPNRPRQMIDTQAGKPSLTRYRALAFDAAGGTTRVELAPLSGRTHQLRVHLMAIGHPILGDTLYAPPEVQALAPRLLLHASALAFAHPATGERVAFTSAPEF